MSTETNLRSYILAVTEALASQPHGAPLKYQFIRDHGQIFTPTFTHPLVGTARKGECFLNAYKGMNRQLRYCEGWATSLSLGIAIEHAWLLDKNDQVVDPTWADGKEYFGVAFAELAVYRLTAMTGYHGIFGSLYQLKKSKEDCYELIKASIERTEG